MYENMLNLQVIKNIDQKSCLLEYLKLFLILLSMGKMWSNKNFCDIRN